MQNLLENLLSPSFQYCFVYRMMYIGKKEDGKVDTRPVEFGLYGVRFRVFQVLLFIFRLHRKMNNKTFCSAAVANFIYNGDTFMASAAILCVDDERVILDSLKRQLRRRFGNDYVYEMAESADDAWDIMQELVDDDVNVVVVVSDWLMPGMKGDEFLIKVHEKYPDIIKILLTGQADKQAVERAQNQANLHSYLHKPWHEDDLVTAITSGLNMV